LRKIAALPLEVQQRYLFETIETAFSVCTRMAWANDDLVLYHGTDDVSAQRIISAGIDLSLCSPLTDFGRGFYTTTNLEQAKNWAVLKAIRVRARHPAAKGTVIELRISRTWLGTLDSLVFIREAPETGFADFRAILPKRRIPTSVGK